MTNFEIPPLAEKYPPQDDCDRQRGEPEGVPAGRPGPHHKDPEPGAAGRELQAAQEGRERGNLLVLSYFHGRI